MPARALSRDVVLPVIVSAVSGDGRRPARESQLRILLEGLEQARCYWPATLTDLRRAVGEALAHDPTHLAVAGGDGTIHHVVNALGDADVTLVPLPFGSGNDFCRGLGLTGDPAPVVAALAARHLAAPVTIAWRADGTPSETTTRLHGIFLANLPTLGAGLRLPTQVSIDDGYFELATLPENSRLRLVASLSRLRSGRPLPAHVLHVSKAVDAEIAWEGGTSLLGDGEDLGRADRFHVRLLPGALRVVAPMRGVER